MQILKFTTLGQEVRLDQITLSQKVRPPQDRGLPEAKMGPGPNQYGPAWPKQCRQSRSHLWARSKAGDFIPWSWCPMPFAVLDAAP